MMVEFVNEVVGVEAQPRPDAAVRPVAFVWRGQHFQITSWGRVDAKTLDGRSCRCHLVQTPDLETWELCQDIETGGWTLARRWRRGPRVV